MKISIKLLIKRKRSDSEDSNEEDFKPQKKKYH